jgi:hypothetical protein
VASLWDAVTGCFWQRQWRQDGCHPSQFHYIL